MTQSAATSPAPVTLQITLKISYKEDLISMHRVYAY